MAALVTAAAPGCGSSSTGAAPSPARAGPPTSSRPSASPLSLILGPGRPLRDRDRDRVHLARRTTITACGTPRLSGAPSGSRPRSTDLGPADQPRPPRHRPDRLLQPRHRPGPGRRALLGRGATALVVRGRDGLDEITTAGHPTCGPPTAAASARNPSTRPGSGWAAPGPATWPAGTPPDAAKVARAVAAGEPGPVPGRRPGQRRRRARRRQRRRRRGGLRGRLRRRLSDQARTAVSSGAAARLLDQWIALAVELRQSAADRFASIGSVNRLLHGFGLRPPRRPSP